MPERIYIESSRLTDKRTKPTGLQMLNPLMALAMIPLLPIGSTPKRRRSEGHWDDRHRYHRSEHDSRRHRHRSSHSSSGGSGEGSGSSRR